MSKERKSKKLTGEEVGNLQAIHLLISELAQRTKNKRLAERLNRVFDMLPSSDADGLSWDEEV